MYKILSITNKETGILKQNEMNNIIETYGSLNGDFYAEDLMEVGGVFIFIYANQDERCMRSSPIVNVDKSNGLTITTENSIYKFEKI